MTHIVRGQPLGGARLTKVGIGLIKILRLLRASRLIDNLTKHLTIRSGYIKASKFFLYLPA